MKNFTTIKLDVDDRGIGRLTLNRPDTHNALSAQMIAELTEAAQLIDAAQDIRVVVLTGAGESFCAGGDLKWMKSNFGKPRAQMVEESAGLATMLAAMDSMSKLLIGRINGQAYGGGVGMVSVCDIVVAADDARFCLTEVTLGLTPANISPYVVARMGRSNARRTFLNARPFAGAKAVELGLVHESVSRESLDQTIEEEVDYALRCAPGAVAATKTMIDYVSRHDSVTNRLYTADRLADAWETEEGQEGVRCFFAKEKASWKA